LRLFFAFFGDFERNRFFTRHAVLVQGVAPCRLCATLLSRCSSYAARMMSRVGHTQEMCKAALLGGLICALLGTGTPAIVLGVLNAVEMHYPWTYLLFGVAMFWLGGLFIIGPVGFVAGAIGAPLVDYLASRARTWRAAVLLAALVGLLFGTLVGIVFSIRMVGIYSPIIWSHVMTGTLSGLVCGIVVLWALKRGKLLLHEPPDRQLS
jgi:hypothetical protein